MKGGVSSDRFTTRSHRLVLLLGCLMIVVVGLRRQYDLVAGFDLRFVLALLAVYSILFLSEPLISRRSGKYHTVYFAVQFLIVQVFGIFQEYQDTWSILYIVLGFQVAVRCSRREAVFWFALFIASLFITLCLEFGLVSGPGRALAYIVIGVLMISYDSQYSRHEDALAESHVLVSELQEAHHKLAGYVDQAEQLAALQERSRMIKELYDSVGQKIFAIQLEAESARIMLAKDPQHAAGQLQTLQHQTQSVLGQMRQLINQWRPD